MSKSKSKVSNAIDNFKNHQKKCGGSCKSDSIFTSVSDTGKGDSPRNISQTFKKNYEDIFPNAYKPSWMKSLDNE